MTAPTNHPDEDRIEDLLSSCSLPTPDEDLRKRVLKAGANAWKKDERWLQFSLKLAALILIAIGLNLAINSFSDWRLDEFRVPQLIVEAEPPPLEERQGLLAEAGLQSEARLALVRVTIHHQREQSRRKQILVPKQYTLNDG